MINSYFTPTELNEALEYMNNNNFKIIAGGTDLIPDFYENLYKLEYVLDISGIKELNKIDIVNNHLEICSVITHSQIIKNKLINDRYPILSLAASEIGSIQIRNMGTIGGNIVNASPAGDLLPPLLSLNAELEICGNGYKYCIGLDDFFEGPNKTKIKNNEILTKIKIPDINNKNKNIIQKWYKIKNRKALAVSVASIALIIIIDKGIIKKINISLGSVYKKPILLKNIKKNFEGKTLDQLEDKKVIKLIKQEIAPITDIRGSKLSRTNSVVNIILKMTSEVKEQWK